MEQFFPKGGPTAKDTIESLKTVRSSIEAGEAAPREALMKLADAAGNIKGADEIAQNLRNIRQNVRGKCRTCDLGSRCYGCRGHAYNVTGDYLAEDPVCWLNSK